MQSVASLTRVSHIKPKSAPSFEVVLAYQDFSSGIRAKEFFDRLVRDHGSLFHFLCHLWKFDVLLAPELGDQAVSDAANADMIVIAAHAQTELPHAVKDWVELWLRQTRTPGALVALLEDVQPPVGSPFAVPNYLREVAERGQMKFFCDNLGSPEIEFPFAVTETQQPSHFESGRNFRNSVAHSHWGINE
jgi:hypothetical protein